MYYQQIDYKPEEILIYLRKSRSDDPLLSVEEVLQRHETILSEWASTHLTAPIPEENIYREIVSGETIEARPEVQKMLKRMESPAVKAVLVVEIQRLSRGDLEDAGRLIKLFRYTNTQVITPQRTYNIDDEYDRDAFERELKRGNEYLEYTKRILSRGRLQSVLEGNYVGSKAPYGWDRGWVTVGKKQCPTLVRNAESDVVVLIFKLCSEDHMSPGAIAKHLDQMGILPRSGKHWNASTIRGILSNPHHNGKVVWDARKTVTTVEDQEILKSRPRNTDGCIIATGRHEALIPDNVFETVQDRLHRHTRESFHKELINPFAGLLYCSCGHAMVYRIYKRPDGSLRSAPRYLCNDSSFCRTGSCTVTELTELVCQILEEHIKAFKVELDQMEDGGTLQKQLEVLTRRKAELEKKEISQWEKYSEEKMPKEVFEFLNRKVLYEKEENQKALDKALAAVPDRTIYEQKIYQFEDAVAALRSGSATAKAKNRILKSCIQRIEYHRGTPKRIKRSSDTLLPVGGRWNSPPIELSVQLKY